MTEIKEKNVLQSEVEKLRKEIRNPGVAKPVHPFLQLPIVDIEGIEKRYI